MGVAVWQARFRDLAKLQPDPWGAAIILKRKLEIKSCADEGCLGDVLGLLGFIEGWLGDFKRATYLQNQEKSLS